MVQVFFSPQNLVDEKSMEKKTQKTRTVRLVETSKSAFRVPHFIVENQIEGEETRNGGTVRMNAGNGIVLPTIRGSSAWPIVHDELIHKLTAQLSLKIVELDEQDLQKNFLNRYFEAITHQIRIEGFALSCLESTNEIRQRLGFFMFHPYMEIFMLMVAGSWCCGVALKNPYPAPDPQWFVALNFGTTVLFTLEVIFKILVLGLALGKEAYLKHNYHIMEFVIMWGMWLDIVLGSNWALTITPFRLMRIFVPIRLLSAFSGLKDIMQALKESRQAVTTVLIAMLFFFIGFVVLTLQEYRFSMRRQCYTDDTQAPIIPIRFCNFIEKNVESGPSSCPLGSHCVLNDYNPQYNFAGFDNAITAMFSIWQIHSLDNWVSNFLLPLLQSEPRSVILTWLTVGGVIMTISILVVNLFVAVILSTFEETRKDFLQKSKLRAPPIRDEVTGKLSDVEIATIKKSRKYYTCSKLWWKLVLDTRGFGNFILFMIVLNTIAMAVKYEGQPRWMDVTLGASEYFFAAIFFLEVAMKMYVSGVIIFFSRWSNVFDLCTMILSVLAVALESKYPGLRNASAARALRVLQKIPPLRNVLLTVFKSLWTVIQSLMFIISFMIAFSLIGKELYGGRMYNVRSNFDTFFNSILSLFQITTGDGWLDGMVAAMRGSRSPGDPVLFSDIFRGIVGAIYFGFFFIWSNYIQLNLLIACLLENFQLEKVESDAGVKEIEAKPPPRRRRGESVIGNNRERRSDPGLSPRGSVSSSQKIRPISPRGPVSPRNLSDGESVRASGEISGKKDSQETRLGTLVTVDGAMTFSARPPLSPLPPLSARLDLGDMEDEGAGVGGLHPPLSARSRPPPIASRLRLPSPTHRLNTDLNLVSPVRLSSPTHRRSSLALSPTLGADSPRGLRPIPPLGSSTTPRGFRRFAGNVPLSARSDRSRSERAESERGGRWERGRSKDERDSSRGSDGGGFISPRSLSGRNSDGVNTPRANLSSKPTRSSGTREGSDRTGMSSEGDDDEGEERVEAARLWEHLKLNKSWMTGIRPSIRRKFNRKQSDLHSKNKIIFFEFRRRCRELAVSSIFLNFMIFCTLGSSAIMVLTGPAGREDIYIPNIIVGNCDTAFFVVFFIEFALKVACDFRFYFSNTYDRTEFLVLILTVLDLVIKDRFGRGRVLRALRILRMIKVVTRNEDMKNVVNAIIDSAVTLAYVVILYLVIVIVFAILGRGAYGGHLYQCSDSTNIIYPQGVRECVGTYLTISTDNSPHVLFPRAWTNSEHNFDNIADAFITLYMVVSLQWSEINNIVMDITEKGLQPSRDANFAAAFFFIAYIFIARFFIANLFIAVIIQYYEKGQRHLQVSQYQRNWLHTLKIELPKHRWRCEPVPTNGYRRAIFKAIRQRSVKKFSMAVVFVNLIFLLTYNTVASAAYLSFLQRIDYFFTVVYVGESVAKLFAVGPKIFFRKGWFVYEMVVAYGSLAGILLEYFDFQYGAGIARLVRVGRVGRLMQFSSSLKHLLITMFAALLPLTNVLVLTTIVNGIFAVVGVSLFGNIRTGLYLNFHDFETFVDANATLFRCVMSDQWGSLMQDAWVKYPKCTRDNIDENIYGDCGSVYASTFFVTHSIITVLIMLNVVVAVIINHFSVYYRHLRDASIVSSQDLDNFNKHFQLFAIGPKKQEIRFDRLHQFLTTMRLPIRGDACGVFLSALSLSRGVYFARLVRAEIVIQKLHAQAKKHAHDRKRRQLWEDRLSFLAPEIRNLFLKILFPAVQSGEKEKNLEFLKATKGSRAGKIEKGIESGEAPPKEISDVARLVDLMMRSEKRDVSVDVSEDEKSDAKSDANSISNDGKSDGNSAVGSPRQDSDIQPNSARSGSFFSRRDTEQIMDVNNAGPKLSARRRRSVLGIIPRRKVKSTKEERLMKELQQVEQFLSLPGRSHNTTLTYREVLQVVLSWSVTVDFFPIVQQKKRALTQKVVRQHVAVLSFAATLKGCVARRKNRDPTLLRIRQWMRDGTAPPPRDPSELAASRKLQRQKKNFALPPAFITQNGDTSDGVGQAGFSILSMESLMDLPKLLPQRISSDENGGGAWPSSVSGDLAADISAVVAATDTHGGSAFPNPTRTNFIRPLGDELDDLFPATDGAIKSAPALNVFDTSSLSEESDDEASEGRGRVTADLVSGVSNARRFEMPESSNETLVEMENVAMKLMTDLAREQPLRPLQILHSDLDEDSESLFKGTGVAAPGIDESELSGVELLNRRLSELTLRVNDHLGQTGQPLAVHEPIRDAESEIDLSEMVSRLKDQIQSFAVSEEDKQEIHRDQEERLKENTKLFEQQINALAMEQQRWENARRSQKREQQATLAHEIHRLRETAAVVENQQKASVQETIDAQLRRMASQISQLQKMSDLK